jgi:SET domain-containing protein
MNTNEFSFILKPSTVPGAGVGVFAHTDIPKDTYLRLFGDEKEYESRSIPRKKNEVPEFFREFCMDRGDDLICPKDFGNMPVGWYLNHSSKNANAYHKEFNWHASRDIQAGEEILIDYNSLQEPEEAKLDYYSL